MNSLSCYWGIMKEFVIFLISSGQGSKFIEGVNSMVQVKLDSSFSSSFVPSNELSVLVSIGIY